MLDHDSLEYHMIESSIDSVLYTNPKEQLEYDVILHHLIYIEDRNHNLNNILQIVQQFICRKF